MKYSLAFFILLFSVSMVFPQQVNNPTSIEPLQNISTELTKMSKSVDDLNKLMKKFFETFSSNQGLRLTEKQQQLLFAFEVLNRAEQRITTLQTLKLNFAEKQTSIRLQLAKITEDLLPESIERYVLLRGSTNAEQLRQLRRMALEKEQNDLSSTLFELQISIGENDEEIRQLQTFIKNIRQRIFSEINKELSDL